MAIYEPVDILTLCHYPVSLLSRLTRAWHFGGFAVDNRAFDTACKANAFGNASARFEALLIYVLVL